mmetsp:Transcript_1888/g.4647  ORF Transcript_1888/g.4647 Transcript_1888/m.4647 type:complete len:267 (+) Transcript_1888:1115-1915(+)
MPERHSLRARGLLLHLRLRGRVRRCCGGHRRRRPLRRLQQADAEAQDRRPAGRCPGAPGQRRAVSVHGGPVCHAVRPGGCRVPAAQHLVRRVLRLRRPAAEGAGRGYLGVGFVGRRVRHGPLCAAVSQRRAPRLHVPRDGGPRRDVPRGHRLQLRHQLRRESSGNPERQHPWVHGGCGALVPPRGQHVPARLDGSARQLHKAGLGRREPPGWRLPQPPGLQGGPRQADHEAELQRRQHRHHQRGQHRPRGQRRPLGVQPSPGFRRG